MTAVISDRKRAANQANAQKSTGPKTAEGKARVRLNAVTHGLTAETIVLPFENADEFESMRAGWIEDWKPQTETRLALVELAVAGAWRLRRSLKNERNRLADKMNAAVAAHDERTMTWLREGVRLLSVNPSQGLEILKSDVRGVWFLIKHWEKLAEAATHPRSWADPDLHHNGFMNGIGYRSEVSADQAGLMAMSSWRLLCWNDPEVGECDEPITIDAEATIIADRLHRFATDMAELMRSRLPEMTDPDLVRARVADLAAYDVSPEGRSLQRYEGQLDRAFRSNLNQLIKLTQTGADLIEAEEAEEAVVEIKPTEQSAEIENKPTEVDRDVEIKPTEVSAEPKIENKPTEFVPYEADESPTVVASLVTTELQGCLP